MSIETRAGYRPRSGFCGGLTSSSRASGLFGSLPWQPVVAPMVNPARSATARADDRRSGLAERSEDGTGRTIEDMVGEQCKTKTTVSKGAVGEEAAPMGVSGRKPGVESARHARSGCGVSPR